jgi:hypothetical protein
VSSDADLLAGALALAAEGFAVLPLYGVAGAACSCRDGVECHWPGRHPDPQLVPHGLLDASRDPEVVAAWWKKRPQANIGLRTGLYEDRGYLVVLDVDRHPGGSDGFAALTDLTAGHEPPATRTTATGRKGQHLYFWSDVEVRGRQPFVPGIDIKGTGGYVVAAPSRSATGLNYEGEATEIAVIPNWLARRLAAPTSSPTTSKRRGGGGGPPSRSRRDWAGDVGVLADWDKRDDVMAAVTTRIGIRPGKFAPPNFLRATGSGSKSMELVKDDAALWVVMDHGAHKHGALRSLTLTEAYAAYITGTPERLGNRQAAWKPRMLVDLGFLKAFTWVPPVPPATLTGLPLDVFNLLVDVTTCRWTLDAGKPVLCSIPFMKHWATTRPRSSAQVSPIGRASVGSLTNARLAVIEAGLFTTVDYYGRGRRASPLMLPQGYERNIPVPGSEA